MPVYVAIMGFKPLFPRTAECRWFVRNWSTFIFQSLSLIHLIMIGLRVLRSVADVHIDYTAGNPNS